MVLSVVELENTPLVPVPPPPNNGVVVVAALPENMDGDAAGAKPPMPWPGFLFWFPKSNIRLLVLDRNSSSKSQDPFS